MDPTDLRFVATAIYRTWQEVVGKKENSKYPFSTTQQELEYVKQLERELCALGYKITKE